jgi:hypothetical protein
MKASRYYGTSKEEIHSQFGITWAPDSVWGISVVRTVLCRRVIWIRAELPLIISAIFFSGSLSVPALSTRSYRLHTIHRNWLTRKRMVLN